MTIQIGKPVKGSVPLPVTPVALSTPDADSTRPWCGLTTGSCFAGVRGSAGVPGSAAGELGDTVGVLTLPLGPCAGSPGLPGSGVGFGRGLGVGGDCGCEPQALPRFPFRACTSTS